jgi:glycosyltransferase involved in cell wall biosynthesis
VSVPVGRVTLVLGTSTGGVGAHVRMLATGLARRGVTVTVAGPPSVDARFFFSTVPEVEFSPVSVSAQGRAGDLAGILRLRKLLLQPGEATGRWDNSIWRSSARQSRSLPSLRRIYRPTGDTPKMRAGAPARASRPQDVVHAHGLRAGAFTVLALLSAGGRRPRIVVTAHNAPPAGPLGGGATGLVYRLLELIVARGANLVLCVSPDLEGRMRAAGARRVARAVVAAADSQAPDPVVGRAVGAADGQAPDPVVGRAVGAADGPTPALAAGPALGDADALRSKEGRGRLDKDFEIGTPTEAVGRPVVLAAGRLVTQKGFDVLLSAAARWRDLQPAPLAVIAGDGPLSRRLKAQAVALDVPAVFLGHSDDVPRLLAGAAVFALPSRWEGQPLVLQEALRAGAPVVATRVGGIPAMTGEDAALLVPPGDAVALGDAVRSVLTDPALASRLAAAARTRAAALPTEQDAVAAALAAYGAASN